MLSTPFSDFNLRTFSPNVRRFYLFAVPIFSGLALFGLLFNLYLIRLGYREDFIGQLSGLFPLTSGILAVPTGILSDRIGRKPFLYATAVILGITQLALCLTTSSTWLLVACALGGSAGAFLFVNFVPFLAENAARERRGQAISIWMSIQVLTRMIVSLGGGLLPDLMAYLTGATTEMPEPFRYALILGAACSFLAIIPLMGIGATPSRIESADEGPANQPVPWKYLLTFTTISGFRGLSMGLSYPFFNIFFESELHTSTATIGVIFFLSQVLGFPSTLTSPIIARRFGHRQVVVSLRVIGGLTLAALGLFLDLPVVVAIFLLTSITEAITTPTEMTFATNTVPREYWGRLQSFRVMGFQIPSGFASFWAGNLVVRYGYWVPFALAGLTRFVSAMIFMLAFGIRRTDEQGGPPTE